MNTRELNDAAAQYERATRGYRQQFDGLTAERLDELEDLADADVPAALVAERLGLLADWQERLQALAVAVGTAPALQPYVRAQRAAYEAAHAKTNAAFVGWYFGGWSALPDSSHTTGETDR